MKFIVYLTAASLIGLGAFSASAADLRVETIQCEKHTCYGAEMRSYTLKVGDNCTILAKKSDSFFENPRQVELINFPLTGFTCNKAAAGQVICHPTVKPNGKPC